jgi:hypothetical protein
MGAVSKFRVLEPIETDRPTCQSTDQLVASVLKDITVALWPHNAAANLAAEIGCSVRTVERYMEGSRDWSGDAIAIIVSEILRRHRVRNVKVTARR